jgi:hypothetical protein
MKTTMKFRAFFMSALFLSLTIIVAAQTDPKAVALKNLETAVANAKAKVAVNERKLAIADSLVSTGTQMVGEAKTSAKAIDADSKKLDKDYSTRQKPLVKLASSKDRAEAAKARVDLKVIDTQYKADTKAIETRIKDATKKQTTGDANIVRGKTNKKNAQDALKASQAALKAAEERYNLAAAPPAEKDSKGKSKK